MKSDPVADAEEKVATAARVHARAFEITSPTNMTSPNVTSPTSSALRSSVTISWDSKQISTYEKLAQSLDVSAAASIEYGFVEASAEAKYLNRAEFEESFLTYVVKIDAQRQPETSVCSKFNWNDVPNPQATYGDRYISGFVTGGALYARVSIKSKDFRLQENITASANLAFSAFKAEGKVSAEVQKAMEDVQKNSEITTNIVWIGAPPEIQESLVAQADLPDLLQLKEKAEKFASLAKEHDWRRFAVVEKYENCPNWRGQFQPLDYSRAKGESWNTFNEFATYSTTKNVVEQTEPTLFRDGSKQQIGFQKRAVAALEIFRDWVNNVARKPAEASNPPDVEAANSFYREVLDALKTRYFVQFVKAGNSDSKDYFIAPQIYAGSTKMWELAAFSFAGIPGTKRLSFGSWKNDASSHTIVVGKVPSNFNVKHDLWMSFRKVEGVFDEVLDLFTHNSDQVILYRDGNHHIPIPGVEFRGDLWGMNL
ncbi:hypothetical protein VFPBJ_11510 [Purpureocillium lilacinum]|uniref:MACPF domain-containing protein n=1 Tax=Purpureocillium lilacinum TaxID=33203 RepID=A0A179F6X5_PURLI|nr:hypothetical protein VFPBJ_11510 [Purpureocillium lilacinum]